MRINNYRVEKNDKKAVLVKESGVNYPKHDNLMNPKSIFLHTITLQAILLHQCRIVRSQKNFRRRPNSWTSSFSITS